jgi:RND superfamily putative drug exporter
LQAEPSLRTPHGVAGVERVIAAAGLIMSSVFFSFLLAPDRVSKEFGLLLGVAILTDTLLMRLTLVSSLLTLLQERSWAMPRWLGRLIPGVTIEPPGERPTEQPRPKASETAPEGAA